MSRLTSPGQVNFAGVGVFLESGQQLCFRCHSSSVSVAKHREVNPWLSILVDLFIISTFTGLAHLEQAWLMSPLGWLQAFCLGAVARRHHVFGNSHLGNSNGWVYHSLIPGSGGLPLPSQWGHPVWERKDVFWWSKVLPQICWFIGFVWPADV